MSAKADCEELMNVVLPFAEQMLGKHGEFLPFGGAMCPSGEIVWIAGHDGREHPPSIDIIRLIKEAFVQGAAQETYKATAIVYDVRIALSGDGVQSDAISVSLNHRDAYSVIVMFPYALRGTEVLIGEAIAQAGEADVFAK
jgi:hypothetical protein